MQEERHKGTDQFGGKIQNKTVDVNRNCGVDRQALNELLLWTAGSYFFKKVAGVHIVSKICQNRWKQMERDNNR